MARYNVGDKVQTTDTWNDGLGIVIPKGSIVKVECDTGKRCRCSIQGISVWYEYEWLGYVVENGVIVGKKKTNADKIRSMSDEELADMLHNIGSYVENGEPLIDIYIGEDKSTIDDSFGFILKWLQSEV